MPEAPTIVKQFYNKTKLWAICLTTNVQQSCQIEMYVAICHWDYRIA